MQNNAGKFSQFAHFHILSRFATLAKLHATSLTKVENV